MDEVALPVAADYEFVEILGRGGMSVVYRARHRRLKVDRAIKVFDVPPCTHAEEFREKFMAEARLLADFNQARIVRVHDCGMVEDGRPYLAMDLAAGTLAARLRTGRGVSPEEISRWWSDLREALAFCHERGVVHSDLKAENILLDAQGHALLSDFGIARITDSNLRGKLDLSTATLPGGLGTAYTLAPEQRRGEKATPASDVYALGVLMYKLVTGIWYEGSPRLLGKLKDFSPTWRLLLTRMLAANPAERLANACLLPETAPGAQKARRGGARLVAAVFLLLALALGGGWWWGARSRMVGPLAAPPEEVPAEPAQRPNEAVLRIIGEKERRIDCSAALDYDLKVPRGAELELSEEDELSFRNGHRLHLRGRLVGGRRIMAATLYGESAEIHLKGALHLDDVSYPQTNTAVLVFVPENLNGHVLSIGKADGDSWFRTHVDRHGRRMDVRAGWGGIWVTHKEEN